MDLSKIKKIYMIGIKGVGMTMLAQYLVARGFYVSGSDTEEKFMTDPVLKKLKIKVHEGFAATNIPSQVDLIIYSTAYNPDNNIELQVILNKKVPVLPYAQALSKFFNQSWGVAVIGSHGKTTTSAWLGFVLDRAQVSPNVMVGAYVPQFNGFGLAGQSNYLIAELDEYQNKLQYFEPHAVLLNNIDYDHPDFFSSASEYEQVFIDFIKKIPERGFLIANFDDERVRRLARVNCRGRVISYGINEAADYVAYDIKIVGRKQYFKVKLGVDESESEEEFTNDDLGDFSISLPGRHNIYNALAVIAASIELDVSLAEIRKYLEEFKGTQRRMQLMGKYRQALIFDDYAHHPTEIKETLRGVRDFYPDKKLIVVFHPHTFTRTKALLNDFARSFDLADEVIVLDIYGSAREKQGGVHSRDLVVKIKEQGKNARYIPDLKSAQNYLRSCLGPNDLVILMGAGDVFRIGEFFNNFG